MGPNISEKFVPGGTNFRGVQIKRDMSTPCSELLEHHQKNDGEKAAVITCIDIVPVSEDSVTPRIQ